MKNKIQYPVSTLIYSLLYMKKIRPQIFLNLFLLSSISLLWAGDAFNPEPRILESPDDPADAVLKRLSINSDGKTPVIKKLDSPWINSLANRGEPKKYTKDNSKNFSYIGMPIGGIAAGEIFLSGDGRLWNWDLFGTRFQQNFHFEQGEAYKSPHIAGNPNDPAKTFVDQGFAIKIKQGDRTHVRSLDKDGFSNISFSGQYPIGRVDYSDPACPVSVQLEAFSPFIPSNLEDSTFPATILSYTVKNSSSEEVQCTVGGWMENPVGINLRSKASILLENSASKNQRYSALNFRMKEAPSNSTTHLFFDDFESGKFDRWTVEGNAFGNDPLKISEARHFYPLSGAQGKYFVDTYIQNSDKAVGKLTSAPFVINSPYISFLVGGGKMPQQECINLLLDDKIVHTATGQQDENLRPVSWDVKSLMGRTAQLQIVDQSSEAWGHILVDNIVFAEREDALKNSLISISQQPDVGNMTLAVMGCDSEVVAQIPDKKASENCFNTSESDFAQMDVFGRKSKLYGATRRSIVLAPGEKKTVSFIVAWYFPNPLHLWKVSTPTRRQYAVRFKSAQDVVDYLVTNYDRLAKATRDWTNTWYDSSLPYYFLDRTFLNASTLASSTVYLLEDGRFYGYEGRYSCNGTTTHVYGHQQLIGSLFPDLEIGLIEKCNFDPKISMLDNGGISMHAEIDRAPAVDGQSGIILRSYLIHRMSVDNSFLLRNYSSIKKATDYLILNYDKEKEGILNGAQANTMDAAWFGKNAWLSLFYQVALRATAEMSDICNDGEYAKTLRNIANKGRNFVETQLFNGEYFNHLPDPAHPESPGTFNGCALEQVMGQNWAYQVGLGDVVDHNKLLVSLNSIWKYNFTTDVGLYRNVFKNGRWYAMSGEGGLIMCTFPHGGEDTLKKGQAHFSAYNNECWAGSEYTVAAVMMWAGQVDKALAEIKTLNDRYDGIKRNPWDECECGSHYIRSMASYGVFTAACGFEYNGPKGMLAFAPRVSKENFKSAFNVAEGWGSFSQKYFDKELSASIDLRYGKLRLKHLSLMLPPGHSGKNVEVKIEEKSIPLAQILTNNRMSIEFSTELLLMAGQSLKIIIK